MKASIQFMDKSPALSRLGEIARYHVLTRAEQEKYMKEYDDYVVLKDAMNVKYQEGAEKGEKRGEKRGFQKGMAQGIAQGMAQGIAQGEREAHLSIARQMKEHGMAVDLIVKFTGLSAEEIEQL